MPQICDPGFLDQSLDLWFRQFEAELRVYDFRRFLLRDAR